VTESANVELVRSIFAAWERGDYSSVEWAQPDIEFIIADGPTPGSWVGIAGMAEGWSEFLSAWKEHSTHAQSYRQLDDERILALTEGRAQAKRAGIDFSQGMVKTATLFHVRSGRVARLIAYFNRDRALADLGLKE
jgi:ketosteroid isomerase-like protein